VIRQTRPDPRQRVCVLFPHLQMGGGETAMIAAAEALRRHFSISVCALDRRHPPAPATGGGVDLRRELQARFGDVTFAANQEQLQTALAKADAVIWYGLNSLTPLTLAGISQRPRSLRVVHTDKEEEIAHHRRWQHVIDATACVAPHMQRRIPGAAFIPNTCSPDRLKGRRLLLFPTSPPRPILGWAGRLLPFKNVAWLIERLQDLDCNLVVQGIDTDDLTAAQLAELAARHGTSDRLRFLPPSPSVGTLLRSVDALVVLSLHEGFPMTVVEAGLLAIPVISTRAGALPDLFPHEILFLDTDGNYPDPASLRRGLASLTPDWGLRLHRKLHPLCLPSAVAALYAAQLGALPHREAVPWAPARQDVPRS
jgi:glycosyltransferase involved in cell wall biosynthesis